MDVINIWHFNDSKATYLFDNSTVVEYTQKEKISKERVK